MPEGWKKVTKPDQVERRLLWSVVSYNDTVFGNEPSVHAWDGPDSAQAFLTTMTLRRDPSVGIRDCYDDIFCFLKQNGMVIQERGAIKVDSTNGKWWVQTVGTFGLYQHCFMFAKELNMYIFYFTTTDISTQQQEQFKKIIQTVVII